MVPDVRVFVLTGVGPALRADVLAAAEAYGIPVSRLRLFDYVDAESRNALLAGAAIFLFLTLYEGFGLPILGGDAVRRSRAVLHPFELPGSRWRRGGHGRPCRRSGCSRCAACDDSSLVIGTGRMAGSRQRPRAGIHVGSHRRS